MDSLYDCNVSHDLFFKFVSLHHDVGIELPYPSNLLGWEVSALVVLMILDGCRLLIGNKGNRLRRVGPMVSYIATQPIPVKKGTKTIEIYHLN